MKRYLWLFGALLAATPLRAQAPQVGVIDFYGLHKLTPADLAGALALQIGDTLPNNFELKRRLLSVPGVADAAIDVACCEQNRAIVYVGIRENGSAAQAFWPVALETERLADEILTARDNTMPFYGQTRMRDLLQAMKDPDPNIRSNAMRALTRLAVYKQEHPAVNFTVPYQPFVQMLNSLEWTDRSMAAFGLVALTEPRAADLLQMLRDSALTSLVEMARWRVMGHAAPAGIILGRIANMPEDSIFPVFRRDREGVIGRVMF